MRKWLFSSIIILYSLLGAANAEMMNNKLSNKQSINALKGYLQEIKSVAIDFIQEDLLNNKAEGKLLLNKPYQFRCNYYSPFPLLVIGNRNYVSVYDYDMKHVSWIKANENIFNFLLEDGKNFEKYLKFESIKNYGNIFEVTIYHSLTEKRSQIIFNKNTKQIQVLKIFEGDNIITITFKHLAKVKKFDKDLFKLKNLEVFGIPYRFEKSDIEKKYFLE